MTACSEELSKGSDMAQSLVNYRNVLFTSIPYLLSSTFFGVTIHYMSSTMPSQAHQQLSPLCLELSLAVIIT